MSVQILSKEIRSKIRSGIIINTLVDCVTALVQNSIDASANCVAVRIDLPFYKIQVVDNGLGINKHDFELIGERYATSKCHCLGDLGNPKYYGYRGEALASLCEISQELTIASRTQHDDKTYTKTFRGSSSRIHVSTLKRPSSGTTVTICGFLYNLPVRQAAISGPMELEWVRRSLECLAISNPAISFSLRDDSSDAWCFRVPKTDSVVTTFSHIFGSVWASTLKPVVGSTPPFRISGVFSLKGHRNKNYQFLYIHKRRIANHRLCDTINQLFGSPSPRRSSEANEKYPVFVLKVECSAEFYDVGYHPSKTVVEFKKFDVLEELVKSTLITFLGKNLETSKLQAANGEISAESLDRQSEENLKISAQNYKHSLHSLAAKRPHNPEAAIAGIEDVACKRFNESQTPLDIVFTPTPTCDTSKANLKSLNSFTDESSRMSSAYFPTDGLGPFSNPSPDLPRPIHLSPALDHRRAALGKFIDVKKRQERIGKAIADLRRFSHKVNPSESSPHVSFLKQVENHNRISKQDSRESTISCQKSTEFQNVSASGSHHHQFPNDISSAASANLPSTDVGRSNVNKVHKRTKTPNDSAFPKQRIFTTSGSFHLPSTSESVSPKQYFPESSFNRNCVQQPKVNQLMLEDSRESDSLIQSSMDRRVVDSSKSGDMEKTPARSVVLNIENDQPKIHGLPEAIISSGPSDASLGSQALDSSSLPITTIPQSIEMLNLNKGCEEPLREKRQWFLGTELLSKRDIYVNGETGHSYYGRPPAVETPSLTSTLVAGHPLPLDTSTSDNQLATKVLPVRPWRSRIPDHDTAVSGDDRIKDSEELSVEKMLQAWENPVFKVDPLLKSSLGQIGDMSHISALGLQPYVFHKAIFEHIKVIAQVDHKFIVCSTYQVAIPDKEHNRRLLVAFDQHAVHERIRLEDLIRDAEIDNCPSRLKTTELDPPLTLHLPSHVARVCLGHQVELRSKGVELAACNDTDGDHTPVCICQIPSCLVDTSKGADTPTVEASVIENLLCELVETLENTGSFGAEIPKIIVDSLKSRACHGAIKFGDPLSVSACQNLIKLLSQCKMPFFCAHGRPSIVPLFDYNLLTDTEVMVWKPNLGKLTGR